LTTSNPERVKIIELIRRVMPYVWLEGFQFR
jgi:hypothetical protein